MTEVKSCPNGCCNSDVCEERPVWVPAARDVLATLMWAVQYDTPYGWVTESAFASQNQSRARLVEMQGKNPTIRFRVLECQLEV